MTRAKAKQQAKELFEVIENQPGSRLIVNRSNDEGTEIQIQSFGQCSKRLIVVGAKILRIEPVEETVVYHLPENEKGQATALEGQRKREEAETVECVLAHLDNGRTIQLSQSPLSIEDYRVIDGRLEWPADDRPRI